IPLVRRTRATLRRAEFGFFGVEVYTRVQTPRFCGLDCSAGDFVLYATLSRPALTSWLIVGIPTYPFEDTWGESELPLGEKPAHSKRADGLCQAPPAP